METQHILLVCPDNTNSKLIKQTGHLAIAMMAHGFKVSVQTNAEESSILQHLVGAKVFLAPHAKCKMPWQSNLDIAIRKRVQTDETISLVHMTNLTPETLSIAYNCIRNGIPTICQATSGESFNPKKVPLLLRKRYVSMLNALNHVVVNSPYLLEQAQSINLSNVSYIPEGVDIKRFKPVLSKRPIRRELELPESATLVCCMANIKESNKQLDVIKSCMPLNDLLHILFVGEVEELDYLERVRSEISRLGVDAFVTYRESVDNPEDYLKASDVFMLLGGIEDRQTTILEAQSSGLPVVLAPSASSLVLTGGNKNGIIYYPNNQLAKKGVFKILNDPNYRQGRSIHARPFVKKSHNLKEMMENYAILFKNFTVK